MTEPDSTASVWLTRSGARTRSPGRARARIARAAATCSGARFQDGREATSAPAPGDHSGTPARAIAAATAAAGARRSTTGARAGTTDVARAPTSAATGIAQVRRHSTRPSSVRSKIASGTCGT